MTVIFGTVWWLKVTFFYKAELVRTPPTPPDTYLLYWKKQRWCAVSEMIDLLIVTFSLPLYLWHSAGGIFIMSLSMVVVTNNYCKWSFPPSGSESQLFLLQLLPPHWRLMVVSYKGTSWTAWRFFNTNIHVHNCACLCSRFSYWFLLSREHVFNIFFIIQYIVVSCSSAGAGYIWWNFHVYFFCDIYLTEVLWVISLFSTEYISQACWDHLRFKRSKKLLIYCYFQLLICQWCQASSCQLSCPHAEFIFHHAWWHDKYTSMYL
jgi:hypothetical protein